MPGNLWARPVGVLPVPLPELSPLLLQAALFIALLAAASAIDVQKRIIPNTLCALIAGAGLLQFSPARLLGVLAALPLLIAAMRKPGSMGGGDIKLTAAVGLVLGLGGGLAGLAIGLTLALLFHGARQLHSRLCQKNRPVPASLPLAPFLSLGFLTAYFTIYGGIAL